jgi:UDP-N-acetylmuramate--alanine ligase
MSEERIKQVHFIGVGGVGMSGIARVAHDQGMQVSGSDIKESRYTKQLREAGITVFIGQKAENIPEGNPVIVISTAILENNPELIEARRRGLEIWHRAQMLAHLGVGLDTLAVAGTHGKTTTSSMLASALDALGADPTFLIGGIVRAYGTNAHSGTGDHYVVEADESDKSFTYLSPKAVLVTNIEADHLDHYKDLDEIYDKFHDFMGLVPEDGVIVACGEEPHVVEIARSEGRRMYTYGFNEGCDVRITSYEPHGIGSRYTAVMPDGTQVEGAIKQNPGRHNVLNATGVVTLLWALGFDAAKVAQAR